MGSSAPANTRVYFPIKRKYNYHFFDESNSICKLLVRYGFVINVSYICRENRPIRLAYKPYFFSQQTIFFSHNLSTNVTFSRSLSAQTNSQISFVHRHTVWHCIRRKGMVRRRESSVRAWRNNACVYITQQQRLVKALPALSTTACISGKSQEDTSILITQVATSSSLAVPARIQKSFPGYLSSARQG